MAENKYITQTQENGSVLIAEEVLVNIISLAVAEVEGAELSGKPGINWGKGIKLTIEDDNAVTYDYRNSRRTNKSKKRTMEG